MLISCLDGVVGVLVDTDGEAVVHIESSIPTCSEVNMTDCQVSIRKLIAQSTDICGF